ncbi:hypothetical protein AKJ09_07463 [Labilithrix luteola]|uniref:Uncharacterized protein n=1 Tax=Labilithrix luteola TaxID=1391654 RepID=A0A0K1Q5X6_9BACT|nr:lasso RiPP family leader peptide-containing protein [Labilithrix luteola]AKV00800.1 hypothetical protein AKJ09_07463 [Labilithrix luteola]
MTRTRIDGSQGSQEPLSSDVAAPSTSPAAPARAQYRAPKLRHLGSVRELTLGGTMGKAEGFNSFMMM